MLSETDKSHHTQNQIHHHHQQHFDIQAQGSTINGSTHHDQQQRRESNANHNVDEDKGADVKNTTSSPVFRKPMQLQLPDRKRKQLESHESAQSSSNSSTAASSVGISGGGDLVREDNKADDSGRLAKQQQTERSGGEKEANGNGTSGEYGYQLNHVNGNGDHFYHQYNDTGSYPIHSSEHHNNVGFSTSSSSFHSDNHFPTHNSNMSQNNPDQNQTQNQKGSAQSASGSGGQGQLGPGQGQSSGQQTQSRVSSGGYAQAQIQGQERQGSGQQYQSNQPQQQQQQGFRPQPHQIQIPQNQSQNTSSNPNINRQSQSQSQPQPRYSIDQSAFYNSPSSSSGFPQSTNNNYNPSPSTSYGVGNHLQLGANQSNYSSSGTGSGQNKDQGQNQNQNQEQTMDYSNNITPTTSNFPRASTSAQGAGGSGAYSSRPGHNPMQSLEPSRSATAESFDESGSGSRGDERGGGGSGSGSGSGGAGQTPGGPDAETFEFMKRKKWPQLLMQELIGAAVWCLVPYDTLSGSTTAGIPCRDPSNRSGWKVAFAAPATLELLGYKPEELEGRDWSDVISPLDINRLVNTIANTITPRTESDPSSPPTLRYQLSASRTSTYGAFEYPACGPTTLGQFRGPAQSMSVFSRMVNKGGKDVLFELKGHAYFGDEDGQDDPGSPEANGGFDGGGVMGVPSSSRAFPSGALSSRRVSSSRSVGGLPSRGDDERPCKAFWIMGRKWTGQGDGGGKMLDSFLELKLENERLKQELRDIQMGGKGLGFTNPIPRATQHSASASTSTLPAYKRPASESDSDSDAGTYDEDEEDNGNDSVSPEFPAQARMGGPMGQQQNYQMAGPGPSSYEYGHAGQSGYGQHQQQQAQQQVRHQQHASQAANRQDGPGPEKKPKLSKEEKKARKEAAADGKEKKPKKIKAKPEYLCRNCGRNDSPEWRKGPLGPKTLCNACGLRWAKRNGLIPGVKRNKKGDDKDDDGDEGDDSFGNGGDDRLGGGGGGGGAPGGGGGVIGNYGPGWDPYADQKALGI